MTKASDQIKADAIEALRKGRIDTAQDILSREGITLAELTHELLVYQAELEIQTQELRDVNVRFESSSRRFQQLFKALPQPAMIVEAKTGHVIDFNRQAERSLLPAKRAMTVPPIFRRIGHGSEARDALQIALSIANQQGYTRLNDCQLETNRGAIMQADLFLEYLEDDDYHNPRILVLIVDQTERIADAKKLAESERRFRQIADTINEVFWILDLSDGSIEYVSSAYERIWGRSCAALLQHPQQWYEAIVDADKPAVNLTMAEFQDEGCQFEYRITRPDGAIRWISDTRYPLKDENDSIQRLIGVAKDITEQKAAENAILESNERFQIVAQATSDVVWDWNLVTDTIWWNDGMGKQFGYAPESLPSDSSSWTAHIHPQHRDRVLTKVQAAIHGNAQNWQDEYLFARADGSYALVIDRGFVIRDKDGKPIRMVGNIIDITQQRELEEQLRQSQRLEAIGQLTGGIAHDFNNLLTIILGNAEILTEDLAKGDQHRQLAQMILAAAERGAELTHRLLAFARKQTLAPKAVDVNKLMGGMEGLLRRALGEQVEIEMVQHGGLWHAMVDAPQLENALLNLCINARDAMPDGGRLTLETANVELDDVYASQHVEVQPGQYVMVAVSDTGVGMDAKSLARAFEPFYTTKDGGKGSGLGLSMVYGFIKQSRGHVKIYSELGQGTAVKLYLPSVANVPNNQGITESVAACHTGTEKILLVENDELVRAHVEGLLKQLGYEIVSAANGLEAIEVLKQRDDFDLLFTDVVMPGGMNGPQLADEVHRLYPNLAVLFTSGYAENAVVHHNRLDPSVHLLQKPYSKQRLATKIRTILDLHQDKRQP